MEYEGPPDIERLAEFKRIEKHLIQVAASRRLNLDALGGVLPNARFEVAARHTVDALEVQLRAFIAGEEQLPVVVSWPHGWQMALWEAILCRMNAVLRLRPFASRLEKRWPVRRVVWSIDWHVLEPWVDMGVQRPGETRVIRLARPLESVGSRPAGSGHFQHGGPQVPPGTPLPPEPEWDGEALFYAAHEAIQGYYKERALWPGGIAVTLKQWGAIIRSDAFREKSSYEATGGRPGPLLLATPVRIVEWGSQLGRNPMGGISLVGVEGCRA